MGGLSNQRNKKQRPRFPRGGDGPLNEISREKKRRDGRRCVRARA